MITKQKLGKALLKALLVSPLNIANSRGKWSLSSLELSLPPPTVVHENIHPREGQQRGYNITGGAITGRAAKAVARLHIKRNPREETHTRARARVPPPRGPCGVRAR